MDFLKPLEDWGKYLEGEFGKAHSTYPGSRYCYHFAGYYSPRPQSQEDLQGFLDEVEKVLISYEFSGEERPWYMRAFGLYLSRCINESSDEFIELRTVGCWDFLGYRNIKELRIDGNVGHNLGAEQEGFIELKGNARNWTGNRMKDGEIAVAGNVGVGTGRSMKGGKIHVEGRAMDAIGTYMEGGEIHIEGEVEIRKFVATKMKGGEINIDGSFEKEDRRTHIIKR